MSRLSPVTIALCLLSAAAPSPLAGSETRLEWYGFLRLDLARDTAVASPGNYALYVMPHARDEAISTLSITGRQSRLGLRAFRGTMTGRLELDFYGVSPENKNTVMLRYASAAVPVGGFTLEAGQTSDLISPLTPLTVNYSVAWGAGNIGYRRPQAKLYRSTGGYWAGLSLARNITADLDGDTVVDGEASAVPAVQGRLALLPAWGLPGAVLGLSGHYGRCRCPKHDIDYSNWSVSGDLAWSAGPLKLLAEAFTGANLGPYAGAIYNSDTIDGVRSAGGWANLQYRPLARFTFTAGAGVDDVDEADVAPVADARVRNQVTWLGGLWQLTPEVTVGLEVSRWATGYGNVSPGMDPEPADLRLQWSMQGDF